MSKRLMWAMALAVALAGCGQAQKVVEWWGKVKPTQETATTASTDAQTGTGSTQTPDPTPTPSPEETATTASTDAQTGTGSTQTPDPTPTPSPEESAAYTVTRGARVERTLRVPCSLSFSMTGKLPSVESGPSDNTHLAWAYPDGASWGGGNAAGAVGLRDYALKCYHADGTFAGQRRYDAAFDPAQSYAVRLDIQADRVTATVGDHTVSVDATMPEKVTLGYGWPPEQRPGAEGAVLTDIVWTGAE